MDYVALGNNIRKYRPHRYAKNGNDVAVYLSEYRSLFALSVRIRKKQTNGRKVFINGFKTIINIVPTTG